MMKRILPVLVFILLLSVTAQAQTDPIDPVRKIDWTQVGIPGGIPTRTTVCSTLSPGASAADINNAIASCPAGQLVFLEAGTYNLSTGLVFNDKSNVTLRGAGPTQTILVFAGSDPCGGVTKADICIRNGQLNHNQDVGNLANWTAGYAKDTTVITLDNTTNIQIGTLLILDQENDPDTDTGDVWICSTQGVCSASGPGGASRLGPPRREQIQMVKVTVINGSNITIVPRIYMPNWRAARNPQAWWSNDTPITMSGVEDLTVDHTNSNNNAGITFYNAYNGWVKNVRSIKSNRNHVWFWQSAHNIVRDSYFYDTKAGASVSYGVETFIGSDNLIENNIFQKVTSPMMAAGGAQGEVYGYNYATDHPFSGGWMQTSPIMHATGSAFILGEGTISTAGYESDRIHGPSYFVTMFRNRFQGWEPGKTSHTIPVHIYTLNRYQNIIGNVLGLVGYHDAYQSSPGGVGGNTTQIYTLGWGGNGTPQLSCCPDDLLTVDSLMRWGNYDTVTDTVRWEASEVPSGVNPYGNPVPPDQTIPNSYYLSSRPPFFDTAFGAIPWPPIGPDVTGGDADPSGHAYKIPAQKCFEAMNFDQNGIGIFDANSCYGNAVPRPDPPQNLGAVVRP